MTAALASHGDSVTVTLTDPYGHVRSYVIASRHGLLHVTAPGVAVRVPAPAAGGVVLDAEADD